MAVTWTIATLERNTSDDGVIIAHWRANDSEVVGDITHSGVAMALAASLPTLLLMALHPMQTSQKLRLSDGLRILWAKTL
jgi:hypothetical protein